MSNYCFKLRSSKVSDKIDKIIKQSQKDLNEFFSIRIDLPNILYINSRKQYDEIVKFKTEDWMVGNADGNTIYILDPKIYTKESTHKDVSSFYDVLKHEYTHIAIKKYCGHSHPRWLNEGLCCHLAKQSKKKPDLELALKAVDYYDQDDSDIYDIGTYWVKILIRQFGKQKLLRLLKKITYLTNEDEFKRIFFEIYKIKFIKQELSRLYKL